MIKKMNHFLDMDDERHYELEDARYVVLGVPYDGTSTFVKGADKGPQAILDASDSLELYDIQYQYEAWTSGIHTDHHDYDFRTPESMVKSVYNRVKFFMESGKRVVLTGGEHSVSVGAIQAMAEVHDNLTVLQIDAHADLRDSYHDSPYNHACVMRGASRHPQCLHRRAAQRGAREHLLRPSHPQSGKLDGKGIGQTHRKRLYHRRSGRLRPLHTACHGNPAARRSAMVPYPQVPRDGLPQPQRSRFRRGGTLPAARQQGVGRAGRDIGVQDDHPVGHRIVETFLETLS